MRDNLPTPRIAILIADSQEPFFKEVKDLMSEIQFSSDSGFQIDVFYALGNDKYWIRTEIARRSEWMRYSRAWPLKYISDYLMLKRHRKVLPQVFRSGKQLMIDIPEGLNYLSIKMLASFKYLSDLKYDYVFRTTLSSYTNMNVLRDFTQSWPSEEPLYGGSLVEFNEHPFISGAATLLNRESIRLLLENQKKMNFARIDDVEFGRIFEPIVKPHRIKHLNIDSIEKLNSYSLSELESAVSIRCTTKRKPREDQIVIKALVERLHNTQL
jgi:hypothetical protein